jgi:hypothetical protein
VPDVSLEDALNLFDPGQPLENGQLDTYYVKRPHAPLSVEALRRAFWLFAYCYNRRCLLWHDKPKLKHTNMGLAQFLPIIV